MAAGPAQSGAVNVTGPNIDPKLPTLWLIGDSTVKIGSVGQRGWGDELTPFFDPSKINLINRAIGGRSSRSFQTEGHWDDILKTLKAGDVVVMQFGHNDALSPKTLGRGTTKGNGEDTQEGVNIITGKAEVVHSYGWYLRQVITTAKVKGAIAIVCSPVPHNSWQKDGTTLKRANTTHGLWAKQAAEQEHAFFVDLNEISARGYETLGQPAVAPFFADKVTHTTPEGAKFNARSFVSGLNGLSANPLALALSPEGQAVPAFRPTQAVIDPVICTWKNDAKASLSFTFDDGTVDHFTQAAPMLEKYGMRGTFFIVINWIGKGNKLTWDQVKSLSERGHEIGNHSMTHGNMVTLFKNGDVAKLDQEIVEPIGIIKGKTGVAPVTFAFPLGARNPEIIALVEQHHLAVRDRDMGYDGTTFDLEKTNRKIDSLITKGGSGVVLIHGIDPAAKGYKPFNDPSLLDQNFAYIKSREKDLWVDTFSNVTRYQLTAAACEVKSLKNTPVLMEFELISKEPGKPEKNVPLTVRIDRPKAIEAKQGDRKLELRSQGNATLCDDVIPNGGPVQVRFGS